jgi:hypothetical protein
MTAARRPHPARLWFGRWSGTLAFIGLGLTVAWGFWQVNDIRTADAQTERTAQLRFCESANERTATIRNVLVLALRDPDPRTYDYIQDPTLRAGVIRQGQESRARLRSDIEARLTLRDCAAEFPPPPEGK